MDDLALYLTANPRRPADWRWRLANYLLDRRLMLARSRGDRHVGLAMRFAKALGAATTDAQQFALAERQAAMYQAWHLYHTATIRNARWELESRVLAKEPLAAITEKTGLSAEIIETYISIFFDVQDKPPGYILHVVLGDSAKRIMSEREPELLWKMYAYWCGPRMLDLLIYRFDPQLRPGPDASINAFLRDDVRVQLQLKSAIAMRSLQVTPQTQTEILNLYVRMVELEKNAGTGDAGQESLAAGLQDFLEGMPRTRDAAVAQRLGLVNDLENDGVGLRADEMLLAAAGQLPQNLPGILKSAIYPPRTKQTTVST